MPTPNPADSKEAPWWQRIGRLTIRRYLILMNLVLLCVLFPSISFYFFYEEGKFRDLQLDRTIKQLQKSLESRGSSLARSMALSASQAIAGYDFTFLNIMVGQVASDDPEISYCLIMDNNRRVVSHSNPIHIGSVVDAPKDELVNKLVVEHLPLNADSVNQCGHVHCLYIKNDPDGKTQQAEIMEAIAPIYIGSRLWGSLRLGYSLDRLHNDIGIARQEWSNRMKQFQYSLFSMTACFFLLGVLVAIWFTRSFVRSVQVLSKGVNRISDGDLNHQIVQSGLVCSEVMELSGAFNTMTEKLQASLIKLDDYSKSLEHKVEQRTKELREAQENLMQQAHEAGMAEMAVGILHNIGNAITPAKVSASLLHQKLNKSQLRSLAQEFMAQLENVIEQAVLPASEKKRFIELIKIFPTTLSEEYDKFAADVEQIREKHDHIEGIINLQMRYARLFGDYEEVDLNSLIEDALKMLNHSMRKRVIKLTLHLNKLPKIKIEKAKLIQIIVNLLKNSYEALEDCSNAAKKEIIITTDYDEGPPQNVVLSIKDNGIGFAPADREKLFAFGYTSKVKGSGFGLHSCANYLIANNGSISAHSDGVGKGAEFIIRLAVGEKTPH